MSRVLVASKPFLRNSLAAGLTRSRRRSL